MKVLDKINSPEDLKKLNINEMNNLATDIREGILKRVNKIGGHLGPDLGIVEATIALHYVFNSPKDKFVFDVSHQCYPHKMLTGRKHGFIDENRLTEISGYFCPSESDHDPFIIGHTSTSISLASGLAKARDLKKENYNVIALIGDGSLSGGEAFEGLNNSSILNSNFIVIVNDNEMSIAQNQGGLYKNLEELRNTKGNAQNNFFKTLGFDYIYLDEGNDIEKLIETFKKVKDTKTPVVVHIHTLKGKGYIEAETNKENYHWQLPNFLDKKENNSTKTETYDSITTDYLLAKKKEGLALNVITAATPGATGFYPEFRKEMAQSYTDVAISEEHAMGYISGIAKNGAKPVLGILSSFVQRTYDQLSQDIALNNSPVTILVYWGSITNADCTHLGVFDIPLISNIPNIVYLAPTNKEEYLKMLDWSMNQWEHPVAIRVPYMPLKSQGAPDYTDYSILNKYKTVEIGSEVALIGAGNFFELAHTVKKELENINIKATLINPRFLTGLDYETLDNLKLRHKLTVTFEDGVVSGGFGEKIASYFGSSEMRVLNFGAKKEFSDRKPINEIYFENHLMPEQIVEDIKMVLDDLKIQA